VYVNNVNITNTRVSVVQVTNVYNVYNTHTTAVTRITYVNQRGPAVTAVSHDTFVNARPVGANVVRVDERQIASAQVVARVDVQPVRASVMGSGAPARFRPPAAIVNRQVVATHNPAPPRASFDQRRAAAANVRTETPGTPQPATRTPIEAARPMPANPRVEDQGRPAAQQPEQSRTMPQPAPRSVPRPPQAANSSAGFQSSHPLVRSAPPVQERPETQKSEEQKFSNWQQQRQKPAAAPASPPKKSAPKPPPKDDKSHH
jgi:hypothetical protein